jgi:DNA replication protein DnaC
MAEVTIDLLQTHFRQLRLPTMGADCERLARDAAATNPTLVQLLLRLTELELATRAANAVASRIKHAEFPVLTDCDTYDFRVLPGLSQPKILELARCEWIEQKFNCCLVGGPGTGQTHWAVALGQAACRAGLRVRFFTAAELVSQLEKAQKHSTLDRFLDQLERTALLIGAELGYVSLSRGGVELLFRVFADRSERASMLVTSHLPFSEWNQIFQGERRTAALLDRLTHPLPHFRYEWRELPRSRVDEGQEESEVGVRPSCRLCPERLSSRTRWVSFRRSGWVNSRRSVPRGSCTRPQGLGGRNLNACNCLSRSSNWNCCFRSSCVSEG